jgi:hypothetical protein
MFSFSLHCFGFSIAGNHDATSPKEAPDTGFSPVRAIHQLNNCIRYSGTCIDKCICYSGTCIASSWLRWVSDHCCAILNDLFIPGDDGPSDSLQSEIYCIE